METPLTKADLLVQIHDLVERYIEQELAARYSEVTGDEDANIVVESDSDGDDIDKATGDIWNLETQEIIGTKNLKTGEKTFFEMETPSDEEENSNVAT